MRPFFERSDTVWRRPEGALHFYVELQASDELMAHAADLTEALTRVPGVAVQPLHYIHLTVQRLESYADEFSEEHFAAMIERIGLIMARVPAFQLDFAPAAVRANAIEATSSQSADWDALVDAVRTAAIESGLATQLPEAPYAPHYSLAYCVLDTPDALAETVLTEMAVPTRCSVDHVSLVGVNQRPDLGYFEFETIMRWDLAAPVSRRTTGAGSA